MISSGTQTRKHLVDSSGCRDQIEDDGDVQMRGRLEGEAAAILGRERLCVPPHSHAYV
jgi:hypothetical protein